MTTTIRGRPHRIPGATPLLLLFILALQAIPVSAQRLDWERAYAEPGEASPGSDGPYYHGQAILTLHNGDFAIQSDLTGQDYALSRVDADGRMLWETRNTAGHGVEDTMRRPMILWEEASGDIGLAGNAFPLGPLSNTAVFFYQYHASDGRPEIPRISLGNLLSQPCALARRDNGSFVTATQLDYQDIAIATEETTRDGGRSVWYGTIPRFDSNYLAIPIQLLFLSGGDFAVVGYWFLLNGATRSMVVRCDSAGGVRWSVVPTGISEFRQSRSALVDADGLILLSWERWSDTGVGSQDLVLTRLKQDGTVDWERKYRAPYPYTTCEELARMPDGGLVAVGRASSYSNSHRWGDSTRFHVLRTDGDGNEVWSRTWGSGYRDMLSTVTVDSGGGIVVTGMTGANRDLYLARLFDEKAAVPRAELQPMELRITGLRREGNELVIGLDSPDDGSIEIDLVDMLGRIVQGVDELQHPVGRSTLRVAIPALAAGAYLVRARSGDHGATVRLVILP